MKVEDPIQHKQILLRLRWMTIIITSYLILFGRGIHFPPFFASLLILIYLSSNIVVYFIPLHYFARNSFFPIVLLFDTCMVSLGIYITSQFDTDFYLVYFLIIFFASIARSFKLLMVNALVICGIYGWFLWTKGLSLKSLEEGILLRIPFILIMNIFYGFLLQAFEEKTQRIKKELKEVEESEQRYRQIVEGAHDAVVILDEKSRIKFFNRRFLQLTQYAPMELTGLELTKIGNGLGAEEITNILARPKELEEDPRIPETEVSRKDGEKRKVEVSASQFPLPTGRIQTIVYLKDITDRKRLEIKLIQSEKLRALGEMAAGVAHDLNNVLAVILGQAQLTQFRWMSKEGDAGGLLDRTLQEDLGVIERAAKDGARTVKKIQEFSRPKTDEALFAPLDANELLDNVIELMKAKIKDEAEEKGAPIQIRTIKDEACRVMGNSGELQDVFLNMVLNSIEAMPKGGTITFKTKRTNGHVSIEVCDSGLGIPEPIRHRIFDPFFTTKGVQRSGLGLSISYGIIRRHYGEILVESQEGVGTTFVVKLPAAKGGELT